MSLPQFYAHSLEGEPTAKWQKLEDHLRGVAEKAASFALDFGGTDEASVAGWLHDLGKFRDEFQSYLKKEREGGIDTHHAVYGAALAFQKNPPWPCSFAIAGHHSGLHDRNDLQSLVENPKYQVPSRLPLLKQRFERLVAEIPKSISPPDFLKEGTHDGSERSFEFYIRMLFSCLVDADRLDTEEYPARHPRSVTRLVDCCDRLLRWLQAETASKPTDGTVNTIRHAVFAQCLAKGEHKQGFFSLTVPTGGGKTLSGMAFALAHAKQWELKRVIVVIPFLSIIEQNAAEYRRILDPESQGVVVEHHSAVPLPDEQGQENRVPSPLELAAENWDAPIIVTTSVQFIESLFASSPSQCRKLHNIARSVIILDEVQTLPTHLLSPLLSVLRELKENYAVTFLFMTATQPAFRHHPISLPVGFKADEVTEVTEQTVHIFKTLRRVDYQREGVLDWKDLAERMAPLPHALCVVNVRRHAFDLWEALRGQLPEHERDSLFHLSSAMCAEHRLDKLGTVKDPREGSIRDRLQRRLPCRVVSTQLVEAGVDVDFPVVFRALGPLDSIGQAAGRCNREMKLADDQGRPVRGKVVIFEPADHSVPPGIYKTATEHTTSRLAGLSMEELATNPDVYGSYFSQLFQMASTDYNRRRESTIQDDRKELRFRQVSRKARVIEKEGMPVVAPYAKGKELIEEIRNREPQPGLPRFGRRDLRRVQRFMVNVRTYDFQRLANLHMATPLLPNLELYCLEAGCYHPELGLLIDKRPTEDLCGV
jgi:CRISPR-associated endonuclease/helicase Cas3